MDIEKMLIRLVAERLLQAVSRQLLAELKNAEVTPTLSDGSRGAFSINGYARPSYHGQRSFGVEGE